MPGVPGSLEGGDALQLFYQPGDDLVGVCVLAQVELVRFGEVVGHPSVTVEFVGDVCEAGDVGLESLDGEDDVVAIGGLETGGMVLLSGKRYIKFLDVGVEGGECEVLFLNSA